MRSEVRASPEAEHTVWWLLLCRAVEQRVRAALAERAEPVYGIFDPDYARVFTKARCIAWSEGYALAVHGSFTRDLDLLAVPWADHACDAEHLVDRIADACGLRPNGHPPSDKPHGRRAWTLKFREFGDPRFIDLSVFAATPTPPAEAVTCSNAALQAFQRFADYDAKTDCYVVQADDLRPAITAALAAKETGRD